VNTPNFYTDPTAHISGRVVFGDENYIGPFVRMEAREGYTIQLSSQDNFQDHVFLLAATKSIFIGARTSIAHGARLINTTVGRSVFVGFNAQLQDVVLEDEVLVQHGAKISGVTIPSGRLVPPGATITHPEEVTNLPLLTEADRDFKTAVVEVNRELAKGYTQLVNEMDGTIEASITPNPRTSWNPSPASPRIAQGVNLAGNARLIGAVWIGKDSAIGSGTSIRGDEGTPIRIGGHARIGEEGTFHALKGESIEAGEHLSVGSQVVLHGPLIIGSHTRIGDRAVVFRATLGDHVTIGAGAVVMGVRLDDGASVAENAVVLG
jgi:carbonic anhydrase/acetyltransferase-like protein (isoleucine patch superfamily)